MINGPMEMAQNYELKTFLLLLSNLQLGDVRFCPVSDSIEKGDPFQETKRENIY